MTILEFKPKLAETALLFYRVTDVPFLLTNGQSTKLVLGIDSDVNEI